MTIRILCTVGFIVGLLTSTAPPLALAMLGLVLALLILWHPLLRHQRSGPLLLGLTFILGMGRTALDVELWSSGPSLHPGNFYSIEGTVLESPRQWGASRVFFFAVSAVDGCPPDGTLTILIRWSPCDESVQPGERWLLSGRYSQGEPSLYPGGFSQEFWLWTQRSRGSLNVSQFSEVGYIGPPQGWSLAALACQLRQVMLRRLEGIQDEQARALVAGVVFGETQSLSKDLQEQFRRTGTSHLLAASGMNVALLVGLIFTGARLFGLGPWRVAPWAIPVVILYAYLAGCAPSIARATAGAVMALLALTLGRSSNAWNSLCLSVWILLLWEPRQIYDLGFQLSLAAVVGLIAGPSLDKDAAGWKKSALMTASAGLVTLPFMWLTFHELSSTLLPANLVLGPLVELLFPLGLLLAVAPLTPLLWFTQSLAQFCLMLLGILSRLADPWPLAQPGVLSLALLALAILLWLWPWRRRWLALPVVCAALGYGQYLGLCPKAARGELVVRRVGPKQPIYWLSSEGEELLVLSEAWQEKRARSMLLDLGCLRTPHLKVLGATEQLTVRWGAFEWGKVDPLLPKTSYLEVRTTGCTYTVTSWRPDHEP